MNLKHIIISAFFVLGIVFNIYSLELDTKAKYSFNRTLSHQFETSISAHHDFNNYVRLNTGISTDFHQRPVTIFLNGELKNLPSFLLWKGNFIYKNFSPLGLHELTLYPTLSILFKRVIVESGVAFRFLIGDNREISLHPLYRLSISIIDREPFQLGLSIRNFNDFHVGNITDISYSLGGSYHINERIRLNSSIGVKNSGQIAFASFYSSFWTELGVTITL